LAGLGVEPVKVLESEDYFVVLHDEQAVQELQPDLRQFKKLGNRRLVDLLRKQICRKS